MADKILLHYAYAEFEEARGNIQVSHFLQGHVILVYNGQTLTLYSFLGSKKGLWDIGKE